jgi:hypothetical protein
MDIKTRYVGYASRTFWDFENGTRCVPYIYAGLTDVF